MHSRSKGPSQDEFNAATQVQYLNGRPFAIRHQPSRPQHTQQAQHAQHGSRQGVPGTAASSLLWVQQQQQQQQQQGTLNSNRGQKRFAASEPVQAQQPFKRGKHIDQVHLSPCRLSHCFVQALAVQKLHGNLNCAQAFGFIPRCCLEYDGYL